MKIRVIILILALLSLLIILIGGYFYQLSLKKAGLEEAHKDAIELTENIADHINFKIDALKKPIKALAGLNELQQALVNKNADTLAEANSILDLFNNSFNLDVCYLMDSDGNTIASTNRNTSRSFVGKNYAFRPYFQQAVKGNPSIYMALGITSKKQGIYASHPIYENNQATLKGVVVIKSSVENIKKELEQALEGIMLVTAPHGVIFASNHTEWLYHVLWKPSPENITEIAKTRQFGKGPWNWTGIKKEGKNYVVDKRGKKYLIHQKEIGSYPNWHIIYLHDYDIVYRKIAHPLLLSTGYIVLPLLVLISIAILILYKRASHEINQRQKAEDSLKENEKKLHALSITDELTGLYNRRGFFALAEQHLKQSMRDKKGYFLILIDFDGLKFINDNFGHNEGDMVLIKTANILKESYRESDIIARIGGDEFIVLANETPETNIETITIRLKDNIKAYNNSKSRNHEISLSMGMINSNHEQVYNLEQLIAKADKLMYKQKRKKQQSK